MARSATALQYPPFRRSPLDMASDSNPGRALRQAHRRHRRVIRLCDRHDMTRGQTGRPIIATASGSVIPFGNTDTRLRERHLEVDSSRLRYSRTAGGSSSSTGGGTDIQAPMRSACAAIDIAMPRTRSVRKLLRGRGHRNICPILSHIGSTGPLPSGASPFMTSRRLPNV
jgi:hypothetical protein